MEAQKKAAEAQGALDAKGFKSSTTHLEEFFAKLKRAGVEDKEIASLRTSFLEGKDPAYNQIKEDINKSRFLGVGKTGWEKTKMAFSAAGTALVTTLLSPVIAAGYVVEAMFGKDDPSPSPKLTDKLDIGNRRDVLKKTLRDALDEGAESKKSMINSISGAFSKKSSEFKQKFNSRS